MIQKYQQNLLRRERKTFLSKSGFLRFQDRIGQNLKVSVSYLMCMLIRIPFNNQSRDRMMCPNLKGNVFRAMFHFPRDRRTDEVVANILPSLARVLPLTLESCQKQETLPPTRNQYVLCVSIIYVKF